MAQCGRKEEEKFVPRYLTSGNVRVSSLLNTGLDSKLRYALELGISNVTAILCR